MERLLLLQRDMNIGDDDKGDIRSEGRYANGVDIGYNAFEFVFDFLQRYGDETTAQTRTRVVTTPAYVKAFLHTLTMSIAEYEREFGVIVAAHGDVEDHD